MHVAGYGPSRQKWDAISSTRIHRMGQVGYEGDRKFIYSRAKETLSQGMLLIQTECNADAHYSFDAVATNTAAQNEYAIAQIVTITAADTIVAGEYAGMPMFVDDGTGEGQYARIRTNSGGAAAATIYLYLDTALGTALTVAGSSDITIIPEHNVEYAAVTSSVQRVVGVAPCDVTDEYYFWRQVKGIAPVLLGEAGTVNYGITAGDNTAGSGLAVDANDTLDLAFICGWIMVVAPAADTFCVAYLDCE